MSCHRCLADLNLAVMVPDPMLGLDQPAGTCVRRVTLCPRCNVDDPHAQGLLAFFALYGRVGSENANAFADLVEDWLVRTPPPRSVDADALERDIMAWRNGEFDDGQEPGERPIHGR